MSPKPRPVKYIVFTLILVLCTSMITISAPAAEIVPAPPGSPRGPEVTTAPDITPEPESAAGNIIPDGILPAPPPRATAEPEQPTPTPEVTATPEPEQTTPKPEATATPTPEPIESDAPSDEGDIVPSPLDYEPDEEDIFEPEAEPDPNVEPDEEIEFIDDLISESQAANVEIDEMTHILLIGLDARPREKTGRSDTMIILTMDQKNDSIKMTSLMRDLYVEIPGRKNNRLNSAYVYGGPELLMETVEHNFGIKIDYYVAVNFSVLADVIDQIGGLTIDVDSKYVKRINAVIKQDNYVLKLPSSDGYLKEGGEQLLTGKQAQAYARYRYGTSDGDFGRTVRQREVILKALKKVQGLSMTELVRLALNNMDQIGTNLSIPDMIRFAPVVFELSSSNVDELRIPIDKGYKSQMISGMAVLVPDRQANRDAINDFLMK